MNLNLIDLLTTYYNLKQLATISNHKQ